MNFEECVLSCFDNKEFVQQYNRLTGHHIGKRPARSPIEVMVDQASGYDCGQLDRREAHDFVTFIRDFIYFPVVLMEDRATP